MTSNSSNSKYQMYKWAGFVAMYLAYTFIVLCRKSFNFAMPAIMESEGLSKDDLGLVSSSLNLAYTMSKFAGGLAADHVSPKLLLGASLLFSGILTTSFTAFSSSTMYAVLWFGMGIVQGGAWPACAKMLRAWCHKSEFGMFWSTLSTSMNVACTAGPLASTLLLTHFGWRASLQVFGTIAIGTTAICMLLLVNSPSDVGLQSQGEEVKKDEKGKPKSRGRGSWQDMLKSPFMWVLFTSYMIVFAARTACLDWGQLYLIQELGQSKLLGSAFISSMEMGGIMGSVAAGFLADKLVAMSRRDDTRGTPRMTVVMLFVFLYTLGLHAAVFLLSSESSKVWIMTVGFILGIGFYGPVSLYGVMAIEAAPAHLSGTSHAIVALSANIGAVVAGLPFSFLAEWLQWKGAFLVLEVLSVCLLVLKILTRNLEYKMIPIKKKLQ